MNNALLLSNTMQRLKNLRLDRNTQSDYDDYCFKFKKIMCVLDENDLSISRRLEDLLFDAGLPVGTNPAFYRINITSHLKSENLLTPPEKRRKEENKSSSRSSNTEKSNKSNSNGQLEQIDFLDYHKANCHASIDTLKNKASREHLHIVNVIECKTCTEHKMMLNVLQNSKVPQTAAHSKLEQLHCFLSPLFPCVGFTGVQRYLIIIDNYSKMMFVYTLTDRSELTDIINKFIIHCDYSFGSGRIKTLITPNLNELQDEVFTRFVRKKNIHLQVVENDPFVNYYARSVQVMIKLMMCDADGIDESLWSEAIKAAVYVYNNLPNVFLDWKSPAEIWRDKSLVVPKRLYPFGNWFLVSLAGKSKLYRCRLIGYHPHNADNYKFYSPSLEIIGFGQISIELNENDEKISNQSIS